MLYGNRMRKPSFSPPPNQPPVAEMSAPESMGVMTIATVIDMENIPVSSPIFEDFEVSRKKG